LTNSTFDTLDTDYNGQLYGIYSSTYSGAHIYVYNISTATNTKIISINTNGYAAAIDKKGIYYFLGGSINNAAYFLSNGSFAFSFGFIFPEPATMAGSKNGNIYFTYGGKIYIYNYTGSSIGFFPIPSNNFALDNNGNIYVGLTNSVIVYNITGNITNTYNFSSTLSAIAIPTWSSLTGNVAIITNLIFQIFNSSGTVVTYTASDSILQKPSIVAINNNTGVIAITDSTLKIKLYDYNGNFLNSFPSGIGMYSTIYCITFDPTNGNIVVCDSANGLIIYNATGTLLFNISVANTQQAVVDKKW